MKLGVRGWLFLSSAGVILAQQYVISTYAGGVAPPTPVAGSRASIGAVTGATADSSGNVYFSSGLGCVFKLDTTGMVTRYAGTCRPGYSGDGGPAVNAQIFAPAGLATDAAGDLFIADAYPHEYIRKVSPTGIITTIAGNGINNNSGDGGPAIDAAIDFNRPPTNIAADAAGNVYLAQYEIPTVRRIDATTGIITTVAGNGKRGGSGDEGPALAAELNSPVGVAVDADGNLYIADTGNNRVRKVSTSGMISTAACSGAPGSSGDKGPALNAACAPSAVTLDSAGNLYITDAFNGRVRKVAANTGIITTVAGGGPAGPFSFSGDGGAATSATLYNPFESAVDASGNIYIADSANNRLRKVSATGGIINTVAGDGQAYSGDGGAAIGAQLFFSSGTAVDAAGNLYIADTNNHRVRKVAPNGTITTFAGNGNTYPYGTSTPPGDGGPAASAALNQPLGLALDSSGNLYISDEYRVRKVSGGVITTVAGNGGSGDSGDGGLAVNATLNAYGLALDQAGNLYISNADPSNPRVRRVAPSGVISTFAGNGQAGYSGDGGLAINAKMYRPGWMAMDSKGAVYIADQQECSVRRVALDGTISTYAGFGSCGNGGDGGPATAAAFGPYGIAFDSSDNLYIADDASSTIRKISAATGIITTVAGQTIYEGFPGNYTGDGNIATAAQLTSAQGLAIDSAGDIYIGDVIENAVRKLTPDLPSGVTISGGSNQTGESGWTLPYPLEVTVSGSGGVNVPGVTVTFAVSSGSATLSASGVVTDATGSASVQLTLGANPGSVTVIATLAGFPPVQFNATTVAAPTNGSVTCTITSAPTITSVNSATDFGGFSSFAPGSWVEIKGSNLAVDTRLWTGPDFQGANAPTNLDASSVAIDGHAAFVDYISGGQINAQVPADANTGTVNITVTTCAATSSAFKGQLTSIEPGLLAPASFYLPGNPPEIVASKQYLVALFQDGVTFVGNSGLIPGVPFAPAKPGDPITAYGIGFGPVSPPTPPGLIVSQSNTIPTFSLSFGTTPAMVTYAGLAPNAVGLYQFNITVPQVADGDYPINVSVGATQVPQTVYLTVHQ